MRPCPAALVLVLACSLGSFAGTPDEDDFRPLFNGVDLTGWVPVNTAPSTWTVEDDMLHCTGKPIGELRTTRMFQNFVLELEWRHLVPRGNAGIFVWADDITARGQPFHRSIEVQVLENAYGNTRSHTTHGDIFPIHGARMKPINDRGGSRAFPTESHSRPCPEWNHYRITCQDGAISLAVNGVLVTRGEDCSPRKGYICLESEGGVVDYRNMRILELPDTPVDPEDVAVAERGFRCLYTGVDLSGWRVAEGATGHWKSRDWTFSYDGESSAEDRSIATEQAFGDIGFLFDIRRRDDSITGILLRGSAEAVIAIDPADPLMGERLEDGWNRFEGTIRGDELSLSLNGLALFEDRKLAGVPAAGPIRIEPGGPVDFANVFVRELE